MWLLLARRSGRGVKERATEGDARRADTLRTRGVADPDTVCVRV